MNKHLKPTEYMQWLGIKKLVLIIIATGMLVMPEVLLHLLAVIIHTVYESIAFVLEELLIHGGGFSKFYAQVIIFYTSFVIGVLAAIALARRIPRMLADARTWAIQRYSEVRADLLNTWRALSAPRKIQLMMTEFIFIISMMVLLAS